MAVKMRLIDVSYHNGNIDFSKVKASGIDGVMIRGGYGWQFHQDKNFIQNLSGCVANKLPYGVYLYSYATTMEQAKVEVMEFIEFLKTRKVKAELPIVIDTEDADGWRAKNGNPTWKEKGSMLLMQLAMLEKEGYYAMYYASTSWHKEMSKYNDLSKYDYWQADWRTKPELFSYTGIWQYSSTGKINGIKGNVDLNIAYKDYPKIIKENQLNGFIKDKPPTINNTISSVERTIIKSTINKKLNDIKGLIEKL